MTPQELRAKYPVFSYDSFNIQTQPGSTTLTFHYSASELKFSHTVKFNFEFKSQELAFHIGLAELPSYWKLTCSPTINIACGSLTPDQTTWWHDLFIQGLGQYFYENSIDFTAPNFLTISSSGPSMTINDNPVTANDKAALVPLGGGKDSIVTLELLKSNYQVTPIVVHPASHAALLISPDAIQVQQTFDPQLAALNSSGYLNGHIPYSAKLAFIFLYCAAAKNIPYIAVSNERSSEEGNVNYLGHTINHQYSKTLEFERKFQSYTQSGYFSFVRPLYELQISQLFSHYPKYFSLFKSCNRNQKSGTWCGECAKCVSIALTLMPWIGEAKIIEIMGSNPLTNPINSELLASLTTPGAIKPFECVTTTEEAQVCLDFIKSGQTDRVKTFLANWGPSAMPPEFATILKTAYAH